MALPRDYRLCERIPCWSQTLTLHGLYGRSARDVLLGGTAGVGTLLDALGIGPAVAIWFRVLRVQPPAGRLARATPPVADKPA